jgi:hypothetical protein
MTTRIGYAGIIAAFATFAALVVRIFTDHNLKPDQHQLSEGLIGAFVLAVTIVVVAIPEVIHMYTSICIYLYIKKNIYIYIYIYTYMYIYMIHIYIYMYRVSPLQ